MTEQDYIAAEQAKHAKRLRRALIAIDRTGWCSRDNCERLLLADMVAFSGPRPGVSEYNCYRLTDRGRAEL